LEKLAKEIQEAERINTRVRREGRDGLVGGFSKGLDGWVVCGSLVSGRGEVGKIQDMIKNKYVIPMEDPVEVARRLKKKHKVRLPAIGKNSKEQKKEKMQEEQIIKSGIYIIKDKDTKTVKMPKFMDFRLNKDDPRPQKELSPKKGKKARRYINIAGGNPLSYDGPGKPRRKKPATNR